MDERLMKKLAKIKALADRGVNGEQENAEALLDRLLAKYNIYEEDLLEDTVKEFEFQPYGVFGTKLFPQICANVVGYNVTVLYYVNKRNCKTRFVKCTEAQFIEISEMYEFYRYHLDKGLESYYKAFIQKERLFPEDVDVEEMSWEETLKYYESDSYKLQQAMTKHERYLKLTDGSVEHEL